MKWNEHQSSSIHPSSIIQLRGRNRRNLMMKRIINIKRFKISSTHSSPNCTIVQWTRCVNKQWTVETLCHSYLFVSSSSSSSNRRWSASASVSASVTTTTNPLWNAHCAVALTMNAVIFLFIIIIIIWAVVRQQTSQGPACQFSLSSVNTEPDNVFPRGCCIETIDIVT